MENLGISKRAESSAPLKMTFTYKEACTITGLCRTSLSKAVNSGKLKHFKFGRKILFSADHLKQFIEAHERGS